MKSSNKPFACFILFCVLAMLPRFATGASMSIGGAVWFAWWDISLEDSIRGAHLPHLSLYGRFKMNPTFLYGPVLSIDFAKRFGFSAMFMHTGQYRIDSKSVNALAPVELVKDRYAISKYDLDSTFSFSPVRYFKLFTGFKFQGYDYTASGHELDMDGTGYRESRSTGEARALGAGLGMGVTIPIAEGLYFQWNLSGLYLRLRLNLYNEFYKLEYTPALLHIPGSTDMKFRFHSCGGNTNAALAYVISKISSTIILGFRYQVIYNMLYGMDLKEYILNIPVDAAISAWGRDRYVISRGVDKKYDHFYGLTFAFVYSFEMAREEQGSTGN